MCGRQIPGQIDIQEGGEVPLAKRRGYLSRFEVYEAKVKDKTG